MKLKKYYKLHPQMEDYAKLDGVPMPYLMFASSRNYSSKVVNTDSNGFRHFD